MLLKTESNFNFDVEGDDDFDEDRVLRAVDKDLNEGGNGEETTAAGTARLLRPAGPAGVLDENILNNSKQTSISKTELMMR